MPYALRKNELLEAEGTLMLVWLVFPGVGHRSMEQEEC